MSIVRTLHLGLFVVLALLVLLDGCEDAAAVGRVAGSPQAPALARLGPVIVTAAAPMHMRLHAPPFRQAQAQTVVLGATVRVQVMDTGAMPLSFKWRKGGDGGTVGAGATVNAGLADKRGVACASGGGRGRCS